jgi:hypothetical protein
MILASSKHEPRDALLADGEPVRNQAPHGGRQIGVLNPVVASVILVLSNLPVDSNKRIWKMKIPLKIKNFGWYLRRGLFSPNTILLSGIVMKVHGPFFVIRTKQSNTYSSSASSRDLYG